MTEGEDSAEPARRSGVLVRQEIKDQGIISENSTYHNYKTTSYDLRLGLQFLRPDHKDSHPETLLSGQDLIIPAFSSVVVSSYEVLHMPADVVGKFNLKIKLALRGLFVQMGTQVETYYNGRLFALLQNITNKDIRLSPKRKGIFAIEFYYTSQKIQEGESKFRNKKYLEIGDFIAEDFIFDGTINSVTADLRKEVDAIRKELSTRLSAEKLGDLDRRVSEATTRIFDKWQLIIGGFGVAVLAVTVAAVAPMVAAIGFGLWEPPAINGLEGDLELINSQMSGLIAAQNSEVEQESTRNELDGLRDRIADLERLLLTTRESDEQPGGEATP